MPTIYDVAKRAQVSTYTVSSVLNGTAFVSPELTERVQRAVRELDYTINDLARSLQTRKTRSIGMLIPDIANPFYARVVRGVEDVLKQAGYSLILGHTNNSHDEQTRYLSVFRSKQVDGLLIFIAPGNADELRQLIKARKPVVFVGRLPLDSKGDAVSADNRKGAILAVEHLISKGHRRIALVNGQKGLSSNAERLEGWRRALRGAGLDAAKELTIHGDWTMEAGRAATLRFLELPVPPSALFTANLLMMTGALGAIKERRLRCPDDVDVMSSDDSDWLNVFEPRISTVAQPSYEMGTIAADLVLKRIKTPGRKFERIILEPKLITR